MHSNVSGLSLGFNLPPYVANVDHYLGRNRGVFTGAHSMRVCALICCGNKKRWIYLHGLAIRTGSSREFHAGMYWVYGVYGLVCSRCAIYRQFWLAALIPLSGLPREVTSTLSIHENPFFSSTISNTSRNYAEFAWISPKSFHYFPTSNQFIAGLIPQLISWLPPRRPSFAAINGQFYSKFISMNRQICPP